MLTQTTQLTWHLQRVFTTSILTVETPADELGTASRFAVQHLFKHHTVDIGG